MRQWHSSLNILFNRSATKQCMAGRSCDKAINAHSISEARVLRKIAEDGKVISVVPGENPEEAISFGFRGIGQISTFSGFCSKHDQELFASIDNKDYEPGNKEQEFFLAYRTLSQSFWYTLAQSRMDEAISKFFDDAEPISEHKLPELETIRAEKRATMYESAREARLWRDMKDSQHPNILKKNYSAMDGVTLEFPNAYPVGYSGLILLRHGRSNEEMKAKPHIVAINSFPQNGRYFAILTCLDAAHRPYLEKLLNSYYAINVTDPRVILTHLICGNSESIAINPSYWVRLDDQARNRFIERWRDQDEKEFAINPDLNLFNNSALVE